MLPKNHTVAASAGAGEYSTVAQKNVNSSICWVQAGNDGSSHEVPGQPVYIALVDLTCGGEFMELVKSGLLAALEAMAPASLFALITFSTKVTLPASSKHTCIQSAMRKCLLS